MTDMISPIGHTQLQRELRRCLKENLVPYVRSSPGIGKSDAVRQFAEEYDLEVIDLRLSQCTPEDLQGYPMRDGDKAVFTPFSVFPLKGEPLPTVEENGETRTRNGWILFLDELSSANKAVQAAAYKLILDRQVGSFKLHERCTMVACGNNITDRAVVHRMSTALQTRLVHFDLEITVNDWTEWGMENGIDPRILAYVNFNPNMLMNFDPEHTDNTFACPRTWEFLNRLINGQDIDIVEDAPIIVGTIGSAAGHEFMSFCDIQEDLPKWEHVIDPNKNKNLFPPIEASARFATVCWVAMTVSEKEIDKVLPYVQKFSPDLQIIFCRGVIKRFRNIDQKNPAFGKFAMNMIADLS